MIGKIKQNHSFGKTTRYVIDKEQARLLGGTIAGRDSAVITREFLASRDLNPDIERPVYHLMQSYSYADRDTKNLTDEKLLDLAIRHFAGLTVTAQQPDLVKEEGRTAYAKRVEKFLEDERFGYQFFVARHDDRSHTHTHLVASRISLQDHRAIPTYLDHYRNQIVCRQLERDFDLQQLSSRGEVDRRKPSRKQTDRTQAGEPLEIQTQLQNAIEQVANSHRGISFEQFIERLETQGIEARITQRGKQTGISYAMNGVAMRGSKLGRNFTVAGLRDRYGIGIEPAGQPGTDEVERLKLEQADYTDRLVPIVAAIWQRETAGRPKLKTVTFEKYQIKAQPDRPPELFRRNQLLLRWTGETYKSEGITRQDCEAIEQFNRSSEQQALDRSRAIETEQQSYQALYQRYALLKTWKNLTAEQRDLLVAWRAIQAGQTPITMAAILAAGSEQVQRVRQQQGNEAGLEYLEQVEKEVLAERDRQAAEKQKKQQNQR